MNRIYYYNSIKDKLIAITRSPEEDHKFIEIVESYGGNYLFLPTIQVLPYDDNCLNNYMDNASNKKIKYVVFLSSKAVRILVDFANKQNIFDDFRKVMEEKKIVAIGPKTRKLLQDLGFTNISIPSNHSSEGIIEYFSKIKNNENKSCYDNDAIGILIPRSNLADGFLSHALSHMNYCIEEIYIYKTISTALDKNWEIFFSHFNDYKVNAIIFTSSSSVNSFMEKATGKIDFKLFDTFTVAIALGKRTANTLENHKIKHIVSKNSTIEDSIAILSETFSNTLS